MNYICAMSEELAVDRSLSRESRFSVLIPQMKSLLDAEPDLIAKLANAAAAIYSTFNWHWVGFYRVVDNELVLGPFQGPIACTRIAKGRGVCGTAWAEKKTMLVPNVEEFPGHIACSALSKSEVVIPILLNGEVIAVLDIDSVELNDFSGADVKSLQEIVKVIEATLLED